MIYQITALAKLAGVSVRTLRYYDQIGLLQPAYVGDNGYRYYETPQVDQLQQIRLYRAMGVPLAQIKPLLAADDATIMPTLQHQYQQLLAQRQQVDRLLVLVQATLASRQGGVKMTDSEKFAAFKQQQLANNEATYGAELSETYDAQTLKQARDQFANLSAADYAAMQTVEADLMTQLKSVLTTGDLKSAAAKKTYQDHRQWLSYRWPDYSAAKHRGLAMMYQADDRFQAYYDARAGHGAGELLAQIIMTYAQD
ncbi:MerR family transcriptional regulator [Lactiplantibacillus daowaiensis]|uniref:MerR family transcriptional regulator n=1 Tax=Lactiplantibacillus daowaiensis TaxID=2559918 RepID=A0ABW1RXG1_9LACO|nr:MerR family transcriptional regulator [Lactiplantibacillus daowaiensis]